MCFSRNTQCCVTVFKTVRRFQKLIAGGDICSAILDIAYPEGRHPDWWCHARYREKPSVSL